MNVLVVMQDGIPEMDPYDDGEIEDIFARLEGDRDQDD